MAVPGPLRARWSYVEGSSRQRLPGLLAELPGPVDVFVHDSLHSARNVQFELEAVWERLRPGGVVIVDDHVNFGFHWFTRAMRPATSFAAPHTDGTGMWGFAIKGMPDSSRREQPVVMGGAQRP